MSVPENLARFEVPRPVREVIERLQRDGHAALLVGGCVRDIVLGLAPKDFDVATSARPEQVQKIFRKVIPTGIKHGTVTVVQGGTHVEVTTFRAEGEYVDGRRPATVHFHGDVEGDLSRRDFTINAMAFDPVARRLVDPFGGSEDLSRGIVRCVGSSLQRFSEDGLRPLRAVRFAAVLGFSLEPQTAAAIPQALDVFRKVSRERIRVELEKLLLSSRPELGLVLLHDSGLLACFLPEALGPGYTARAAQAQAAPPELEVRLAAVLSHVEPALARDALARLTFPNKVADRVALLLAHPLPAHPLDAPDAELRRWLSALGTGAADQALSLFLALSRPAPDRAELLRSRIHALLAARPPLTARELALDGKEIMRLLGVEPSRIVGEATEFLLAAVLEKPEANTSETLTALLREWARSKSA